MYKDISDDIHAKALSEAIALSYLKIYYHKTWLDFNTLSSSYQRKCSL